MTRPGGTAPPDALHADALAVLQPGFTGTAPPAWLRRRLAEGLGSVALFARNIAGPGQLAALTAALRRENPEVLVAVDEEGGDVTRLEARRGSSWPGNLALGAVDDTALTRDVARRIGRSLAACGVNLAWAPCADVNSDPRNPVIGVRSFGADPLLCARHTAAWVEGLQSTGVAACAKHFPGHGDTAVDSHLALPVVDVPEEVLRTRELLPFRAAVEAGVKAVMTAHIVVPALDPGRPATLSPAVLGGLLRAAPVAGGLGHRGLVVTDGMEMAAVAALRGIAEGTVLAVAAGADAVCVGHGAAGDDTVVRLRDALVRAVREGRLPEERLAEAAARVRALGTWARVRGRVDGPSGQPGAPGPGAGAPTDAEVGLRAARRALRLTRAASHPFVPLSAPPLVVTLGPRAGAAVGEETAWGIAGLLRRRFPDTDARRIGPAEAAPDRLPGTAASVLAAAAGRGLVLVVRDEHRHPWAGAALRALLTARPDAVVVEMGVPCAPPSGALHIATRGAARVCGLAAVEVLTGERAGEGPDTAGPGTGSTPDRPGGR